MRVTRVFGLLSTLLYSLFRLTRRQYQQQAPAQIRIAIVSRENKSRTWQDFGAKLENQQPTTLHVGKQTCRMITALAIDQGPAASTMSDSHESGTQVSMQGITSEADCQHGQKYPPCPIQPTEQGRYNRQQGHNTCHQGEQAAW